MLENIKLLIGNAANDRDALLALLVDNAKDYATSYCYLKEYDASLDTAVMRMVVEDFNRLGSEGTNSQSFSWMSENYAEAYSSQVISLLNRHRKIGVL